MGEFLVEDSSSAEYVIVSAYTLPRVNYRPFSTDILIDISLGETAWQSRCGLQRQLQLLKVLRSCQPRRRCSPLPGVGLVPQNVFPGAPLRSTQSYVLIG